jgi:hypothetical protein
MTAADLPQTQQPVSHPAALDQKPPTLMATLQPQNPLGVVPIYKNAISTIPSQKQLEQRASPMTATGLP